MVKLTSQRSTSRGIWHSLDIEPRRGIRISHRVPLHHGPTRGVEKIINK